MRVDTITSSKPTRQIARACAFIVLHAQSESLVSLVAVHSQFSLILQIIYILNKKLQLADFYYLIQKTAAQHSTITEYLRFRNEALLSDVWLFPTTQVVALKIFDLTCFLAFSQQMCGSDTCVASASGCESEDVLLVREQLI